jgi:cysteinyl-tRNA synthetase
MGKRFKNFYTLKDLKEKGFSGQDLRFFFFGAHYKKQQNFTWEALKAAHTTLERVWEQKRSEPESFEQILSFLQDDLGAPEAVAYALSKDLSLEVFGISQSKVVESYPKEINELLEKRKKAKEEKDFKTADNVRKEIEDLGYEVMDTHEGQKVKKKISI